MRPSIAYTLARLGIFAACLGIFWLVGLRDLLVLLLVAATVSMLLSLFFLGRLRDRFSLDVADRVEHRRERKHAKNPGGVTGSGAEDAEADSFR